MEILPEIYSPSCQGLVIGSVHPAVGPHQPRTQSRGKGVHLMSKTPQGCHGLDLE